ncbi:formin-like protein 3 [Ananas comosus]|uniref:Formin-like protein 3 n=1 Tax=Ananas comosus TaxID=4615 RepID=A0A6P5FXK5_ANACO|nr:formin-like protein 3 [Ananas comosus]
MCWEIFCCCSSPTDEGTAAQKPPPPSGPPPGSAMNGVSSDYAQKPLPPPPPSGPRPSSETNGASKPPGANTEEPPIAATAAAAGGDSSSQESDKVDPTIKEGNKKSEEVKKGLKSSTKQPIDNTATDNLTKEKEQQVKDVSSEKRGHDKSADRISLQEGKPTFEHAHEAAAAAAAAAASSKPSSIQKNETVGLQANSRRTNQDQGRRVSTRGPGEAMYYRFPSANGVRSEASPIPRKDQPRRNSQIC